MSKHKSEHTGSPSLLSRRGFGGGFPLEGRGRFLPLDFFLRDVLEVAPALLGKLLVRQFDDGRIERYRITEVEAYRGVEDRACHANKGRTPRTEVMFQQGGTVYVYLIYGQYWLLNLVTGIEGDPSAVLIRGIEGFPGPGRVGRELQLDHSFYGESLITSTRIWLEDAAHVSEIRTAKRIGVEYSGEWAGKLWRFYL
ncbi:MAG TPA: 3-methyladenine DNA glycosylase [Prolixibacteraceae bacterium]|nr:3-methyladenine DNA glycosylase [Prolixibacteraceae bacterium]